MEQTTSDYSSITCTIQYSNAILILDLNNLLVNYDIMIQLSISLFPISIIISLFSSLNLLIISQLCFYHQSTISIELYIHKTNQVYSLSSTSELDLIHLIFMEYFSYFPSLLSVSHLFSSKSSSLWLTTSTLLNNTTFHEYSLYPISFSPLHS